MKVTTSLTAGPPVLMAEQMDADPHGTFRSWRAWGTTLLTRRDMTLAAVAALVGGGSIAKAAEALSDADRAFVAQVSQGGMFEVKLGQLAAERGNLQDVKDQGVTEAHDHTLVGHKLKAIAQSVGLPFPTALNPEFQEKLDAVKALSGQAFDEAYLREMKAVHAADGAAFAKEAESGSNPRLRQFAAETHRIVMMHIGELDAVPAEG